MKRLARMAWGSGALAVLLGTSMSVMAQQDRPNRGNFDPEQMRQRMAERYKEAFEVKNDDEWKILQERIEKVNTARMEVGFGGGRGMMGPMGMGRPNRGGDQAQGGPGGQGGQGGQGDRRGFRGGQASPEAEALQKALDSKASAEEIKSKLAKYREARKTKEANLAKAQEELKAVLTVRQEATAVMMGLLN